ncbi:caspase family protein [Paraburkholderia pallida]|uniref:caspase family protein n=1 Tax=Paraburkholderia pallida TaxID=2547399 RepID=UPI00143178A2|nr:caspase family protein [Paraburkholderia pallida]
MQTPQGQQGHAASAPRVALVIGNAVYHAPDRLGSPSSDASLIAGTLRSIGFVVDLEENQTRAQMLDALDRFGAAASKASIAVIYYAGHGFESGGENYLIPVDLPMPVGKVSLSDLQRYAVPLRYVRSIASRGEPRALVVLLDACRSAALRGSVNQSMASVDAGHGELIAFATQPGGAALDAFWLGGTRYEHSPFAWYLNQQMQSGDDVLTMLRHTQVMVAAATADTQRPWFNDGLVGDLKLSDTVAPGPRANVRQPMTMAAGTRGGAQPPPDAGDMTWSVSARPPIHDPVKEAAHWDAELDRMLELLPRIWSDSGVANEVHERAERGDLFAQTALAMALQVRAPNETDEAWYMTNALVNEYAVYATGRHYPLAEAFYGNYLLRTGSSPQNLYTASLFLRRAVDDGFAKALDKLIPLLVQIHYADVAKYEARYRAIYGHDFVFAASRQAIPAMPSSPSNRVQ